MCCVAVERGQEQGNFVRDRWSGNDMDGFNEFEAIKKEWDAVHHRSVKLALGYE